MSRGVLLILEGLDRSGKSTQAKRLVEYINNSGRKAILIPFPERSDPFGQLIDKYLRNEIDINEQALHLAFSANRWQMESKIRKHIAEGTDVVCDRYAFSGVAYSMAKGLDERWAKQPDIGLPNPDVVLFFQVSAEVVRQRGGFGEERLEREDLQKRVSAIMETLRKDNWKNLNADGDIETVHKSIIDIYQNLDRSKSLSSITEL
ncbi:unnamed protein product [Auanema sp. JU1783]|nr:unnamed protein product [Auanema sp. JU1783]